MKEKNIRELAKRMGLITVEDMCQYTIAQLVIKIANKVNELVGEVWRFETDVQEMLKTQNENIQYLLGEGLHLEVENIFDGWVQDGTFDTLLNQSALKKVNDRIDEVQTQTNAQLSEVKEQLESIAYNIESYKLSDDADYSNAFNRIMNKLPENGGSIIFNSGEYILNNIDIKKTVKLIGSGETIIRRSINNKPMLSVSHTGTLKIENITFDGCNYKHHGLIISNLNEFELINCTVKNCGINGYSCGNGGSIDGIYIYNVKNGTIKNCVFENCEREGIHAMPVENLTVKDCHFNSCGRHPVTNESYYNINIAPKNVYYIDNVVENCGSGGFHCENDPERFEITHLVFQNNLIKNCGNDIFGSAYGLVFGNHTEGVCSGNKIINFATNNCVESNYKSAIVIGNTNGSIIVSNNVVNGVGHHGVNINSSTANVKLTNNIIKNCNKNGIYSYNSHNVTIDSNTIIDNEMEGIVLHNSENTIINCNIICNNSKSSKGEYSGIKNIGSIVKTITNNIINGENHKFGYETNNGDYQNGLIFTNNNITTFTSKCCSFVDGGVKEVYLTINEKMLIGDSLPIKSNFKKGTYMKNTNIYIAGSLGSKFIVNGWFKITDGTTNVLGEDWIIDSILTGN